MDFLKAFAVFLFIISPFGNDKMIFADALDCPPISRVYDLPSTMSVSVSHQGPGGVATFSCDPGYTLIYSGSITCGYYGEWNEIGSLPECRAYGSAGDCPPISRVYDLPSSMNVRVSHYGPGGVATFSCDPGYTLIYSGLITCGSDGQWNEIGSLPACKSEGSAGIPIWGIIAIVVGVLGLISCVAGVAKKKGNPPSGVSVPT